MSRQTLSVLQHGMFLSIPFSRWRVYKGVADLADGNYSSIIKQGGLQGGDRVAEDGNNVVGSRAEGQTTLRR